MQLTEQYRPRTWSEVVGQDKVVQRVQHQVAVWATALRVQPNIPAVVN